MILVNYVLGWSFFWPILSVPVHIEIVFNSYLAVFIEKDQSGLLLVFVEIMSDKVILDHKKSYLVSFGNFHFFDFYQKLESEKIKKDGNFLNRPNMSFYGLK